MLSTEAVTEAVAAGWAEPHRVASRGLIPPTAVMLYAPRDVAELEVIEALVRASRAFARPGCPGRPGSRVASHRTSRSRPALPDGAG